MKLYRCKQFYASSLMNEPTPNWPQDYHEPEEMVQQGIGEEALQHAFLQCHLDGHDMNVGDVVGLDSGELFRCEMSGWSDIGKTWTARVQQSHGRKLG